jgi:hypothetical protein
MYDILIVRDADGEMICQAETQTGHDFLRRVCAEYTEEAVVRINCSPEEFIELLPTKLIVGLVGIENKVFPLSKNRLH